MTGVGAKKGRRITESIRCSTEPVLGYWLSCSKGYAWILSSFKSKSCVILLTMLCRVVTVIAAHCADYCAMRAKTGALGVGCGDGESATDRNHAVRRNSPLLCDELSKSLI